MSAPLPPRKLHIPFLTLPYFLICVQKFQKPPLLPEEIKFSLGYGVFSQYFQRLFVPICLIRPFLVFIIRQALSENPDS